MKKTSIFLSALLASSLYASTPDVDRATAFLKTIYNTDKVQCDEHRCIVEDGKRVISGYHRDTIITAKKFTMHFPSPLHFTPKTPSKEYMAREEATCDKIASNIGYTKEQCMKAVKSRNDDANLFLITRQADKGQISFLKTQNPDGKPGVSFDLLSTKIKVTPEKWVKAFSLPHPTTKDLENSLEVDLENVKNDSRSVADSLRAFQIFLPRNIKDPQLEERVIEANKAVMKTYRYLMAHMPENILLHGSLKVDLKAVNDKNMRLKLSFDGKGNNSSEKIALSLLFKDVPSLIQRRGAPFQILLMGSAQNVVPERFYMLMDATPMKKASDELIKEDPKYAALVKDMQDKITPLEKMERFRIQYGIISADTSVSEIEATNPQKKSALEMFQAPSFKDYLQITFKKR